MLIELIAQSVSPGQRLEALYEHFSTRTGSQGLQVVYTTAFIGLLLCGILLVARRIQRAKEHREEQARDQVRRARTAKAAPTTRMTRRLTLIQKRQADPRLARRTEPPRPHR